MSNLSRQVIVGGSAEDLLERLGEGAVLFVSSMRRRLSLMHRQVILDQLSEAQLRDTGIDRWTEHRPRPTIPVEAGLITNLLSMR